MWFMVLCRILNYKCISVCECIPIGVYVFVCIHVYVRVNMYVFTCVCIRLRCAFTWIYCPRWSDSAINGHCADLLRALLLLFTVKVVSITHPRQRPRQRPHVAL